MTTPPDHLKNRLTNYWTRSRILLWGLGLCALIGLPIAVLIGYVYLVVIPNLPTLESVTDYRPKIPLRIYTSDKALIGEFGEEHRHFVPIKEMPDVMKKALLATEDAQFYEHGAIDAKGMARAALSDLTSFSAREGAGTITMQVAREFFLTKKKDIFRKVTEVVLSYRIEAALSKDQILELYMNQIYLGEHAFGFGSAAEAYFGKPIANITLAEAAMLAGLPKGPSTNNPIVNPKRAKQRQQHVLERMHDLQWISDAEYKQATHEALHLNASGQSFTTHAEYAAELVRQVVYKQFKEEAYTHGYIVYTTLKKADQDAAYEAVRRNVIDYDRRHGYRGPEAFIELPAAEEEREDAIEEELQKHPGSGNLLPAMVVAASPKLVRAEMASGEIIEISGEGLHFAASGLTQAAAAQKKIRPGAVIRVSQEAHGKWAIGQLPEVSAAFVSLDAGDGSYKALVGGFDFNLNKFDHVSQAWRQPGSAFKPFIYSAALEKGFSPATLINDVPLTVTTAESGGPLWEPKNDDGFDNAPITMRTALAKSKNVPSIRILRAITPQYAQTYVARFGFDSTKQPVNLTMVLGTGSVTPLQMAGAYAVFANGGYQVSPYMIKKVMDIHGAVFSEAKPTHAGQESERVIDPRNAFVMDSMLQQVVRTGTGAMVTQKLGRPDLAGKTGTTSEAIDGWFAGYSGNLVAVSWMGYDDPKSLGSREFGATLALPAWIDYMHTVLQGKPIFQRATPDGVVQNDGDWMFNEFINSGAVKILGQEDAPAPAPAIPPSTDTPSNGEQDKESDKEREKAIDLFKGGG
ncbi:MAG: penicillin-binding protein 1A [Burkholderiales bacterium]